MFSRSCRGVTAVVALVCSSIFVFQARAAVTPHALISEGMVLQQGKRVAIWGTAAEDEKVAVSFQGQEVSTHARNGRWTVLLENLKAGGPFPMTIAGSNAIHISNVLVGEVWLASGQSNMVWPISHSHVPPEVVARAGNPKIRIFTVPFRPMETSQQDLTETQKSPTDWAMVNAHYSPSWRAVRPDTIRDISAVGYFFARDLQKALGVPVGLILDATGGTAAEAWMSRAFLNADPELRELEPRFLENHRKSVDKYLGDLEKHKQAVIKARDAGADIPLPPPHPAYAMSPNNYLPFSKNFHRPCIYYNGMLSPVLPCAIRGVIWYQGESNSGRSYQYKRLFPAMIRNWRESFGQGEFPFLFVQLAPFMKIQQEPTESAWAELREAQRLTTLTMPNTGMAVITDVGDEKDIHPKGKDVVGARLALAARGLAYGEKIEYSGPAYDQMKVEGGKIVLSFKHTGGGLVAKGGRLTGFTIAGRDRRFVNAEAKIDGDTVIVWSAKVPHPVAVRFGWADYPVVNLWNGAGLPASPFKTDDFPWTTRMNK